jgi:hypothetical protein
MSSCMVTGRLPPESVRRVVRQSAGLIRACYDEGLRRRGPTLAGRVSTKFVIGRDGLVSEAANSDSEIADDKVVGCITAAFGSMRFPEPTGGIVTVVYPYVLRPPGAGPVDETDADADARKDRMPDHAVRYFPWSSHHDSPPPPPPLPWSGDYAEARDAFSRSDVVHAFEVASAARAHDPRDVLALLALGEAYDRAGLPDLALRAYGSIADLAPNDASMLRIAATHLAVIGATGATGAPAPTGATTATPLVLELLRRAAEDRPDRPHGRHAYAMALLRAGAYERAFDVLAQAIGTSYAGRFENARLVLEDGLALVAAAWRAADPGRARVIDARTAALTGPARIEGPSLSFVLSWETDMSDVDLFVRDASTDEDGSLPLVGSQRARASEGYGPESVVLTGARSARPSGRLTVRLGRKGPMGHVMGVVDVIDHDGQGHVTFRARPFVAMNERAEIDLGPITPQP